MGGWLLVYEYEGGGGSTEHQEHALGHRHRRRYGLGEVLPTCEGLPSRHEEEITDPLWTARLLELARRSPDLRREHRA